MRHRVALLLLLNFFVIAYFVYGYQLREYEVAVISSSSLKCDKFKRSKLVLELKEKETLRTNHKVLPTLCHKLVENSDISIKYDRRYGAIYQVESDEEIYISEWQTNRNYLLSLGFILAVINGLVLKLYQIRTADRKKQNINSQR
mgnify:CR=1 FL=1